MARAGLRALEFYDPATKKHGQAHMQARYVHGVDSETILLTDLNEDWVSLNISSNRALPVWKRSETTVVSL